MTRVLRDATLDQLLTETRIWKTRELKDIDDTATFLRSVLTRATGQSRLTSNSVDKLEARVSRSLKTTLGLS